MSTTRERIVEQSAELFRRQGYSATGVKQIVTAAKAPFGSLYHFFPGGKEELGAEAVRVSAAFYLQLIPAILDPAPHVVTGVRDFFNGAAEHLRETDYVDACPIATVALEVSSISETMRIACAEAFESWTAAGARRFERAGVDPARARELTIAMLAALEGAFVLARAQRSTEPLRIAGELAAAAVETALEEAAVETALEEAAAETALEEAAAETVLEEAAVETALEEAVAETAVEEAGAAVETALAEVGAAPAPTPNAGRVRPRLRARWPDREDGRSPEPASP